MPRPKDNSQDAPTSRHRHRIQVDATAVDNPEDVPQEDDVPGDFPTKVDAGQDDSADEFPAYVPVDVQASNQVYWADQDFRCQDFRRRDGYPDFPRRDDCPDFRRQDVR
jgi:hypothetical protein